MKILFVCKANIFRSKIAEAYFNKINKDKGIKASSAGTGFKGFPLSKNEKLVLKELGVDVKGKQKKFDKTLLNSQDLIIVVADDVNIKDYLDKNYVGKVINWGIKDSEEDFSKEAVKKIVLKIIKKVEKLNKELAKK